MRRFSRTVARWDAVRTAASALGLVWLALLGAYVFSAVQAGFSAGAAVVAAAVLAIALAGFLYAWREPAPLER